MIFEIFCLLLLAHFIVDYPLQGDFLSKAKNRTNPIPHVPWYQAMFAHTFMHGMGVWIITGLPILALLEMIIHWWVDDYKCRGEITFNQDQFIHVLCKFVWAIFAYYWTLYYVF